MITPTSGSTPSTWQFHFHAHSESTLNGRSLPIEFHFVYEDDKGDLTVIAVFAESGAANPAFNELIDLLPQLQGEGDRFELDGLNPEELMPANPGSAPRWSYSGSLTTPSCTEGVSWQVLNQPVQLSQGQIDRFTGLYDHNDRPVQPLNDRRLLFGEPGG